MQTKLRELNGKLKTLAVAVSGGSDSMALLFYAITHKKDFSFDIVALNVEHGIRGQSSFSDSKFVKDFCEKNSVPVISYSVDSVKKAKQDKIPVEQAARILRYECFFDAISKGKCDAVATAHHKKDNFESVLFNLFRGTGLKGLSGINGYKDKIFRPLIATSKKEIDEYVAKNNIPFVVDESNFDDDLKRNYIRHKILPAVETAFPFAEDSVYRFSLIAKDEDEYLDSEAEKHLTLLPETAEISIPLHVSLFRRASVMALKHLGLSKDWEKVHLDDAYKLCQSQTGAKINLPKNIVAIKEYGKIVFYKESAKKQKPIAFCMGDIDFNGNKLKIEKVKTADLKSGLFIDLDKLPKDCVIRLKKEGDVFTKFGGGTKSLSDYLTDKKVPLRMRKNLPLLASGKEILVIFGLAISDKVKIKDNTRNIIKLTKEE